jgi:hypothetical protein
MWVRAYRDGVPNEIRRRSRSGHEGSSCSPASERARFTLGTSLGDGE